MDLGIKGKAALVTGGCHGIGLAIVKALTNEGCQVTSICRHTGFEALDESTYEYGDYDILINNVGGGGRWKSEDWEMVWRKNVLPMQRFTFWSLPYMMKQDWGRIITIASIFGKEAGGSPWFTAAKAYQIAFMKSYAIRDTRGITFNSVAPGPIWIEGKEQDEYERYGQAEDVAAVVTFLCSERAKWVNGACITIDGGLSRSF